MKKIICGLLVAAGVQAAEIVLEAKDFVRGEFMNPTNAAELVRENNILCGSRTNWLSITGRMEWDLTVPETGWYQLSIPGNAWGVEVNFDSDPSCSASGGRVGDFWLTAGAHTFRAQRWHWTGFQKTERFVLSSVKAGVQVSVADNRTVIRTGEKLKLAVKSGGAATETRIKISVHQGEGSAQELVFAPGTAPEVKELAIPFEKEGVYQLLLTVNGRGFSLQDFSFPSVAVVNAEPVLRGGELRKTLVQEIDCVNSAPQYVGLDGATVKESSAGKYRESGDHGFLRAQHQKKDCGWFAYRFEVPEPQVPYILEVEYPDDAFRSFCIAVREGVPGTYPVTGGVDSGECYSLSGKMLTHSILFWPKSKDLRAVFVTAHNDRRGAAASKIRVYKVEGNLPVPVYQAAAGRTFANWYEEGSNFMALYGAPDKGAKGAIIGAERWARTIASLGGNMLVPTVSVYQMGMYPSRYNINFCDPFTFDSVRVILMKCEKYGLGFAAEFHPECRELDWLGDKTRQLKPRPNGVISKEGKISDSSPRFNPLSPVNRAWYLGMLEEFARRYADSPAFKGVSLRLMTWANPGLNNFHSLDWGYEDSTVELFEKETGIKVPADPSSPDRYKVRYDWLCANAKAEWIAWRCRKIAEIHTEICSRIRKVRPDLIVYTDVFGGFKDWREAGLDPEMLGRIEGLQVIQADSGYGRRAYTYRGPLADAELRDSLICPERLLAFDSNLTGNSFLFGAGYFEATEVVVPPEALGYPEGTKRTWMSGVVNPAGRHYLERYALAMAEGDAVYLSDGGNAYTVGQPELLDFLKVFRRLPAVRFTERPGATDPVTVREHCDGKQFWFYAVNRERYPVTIDLQLKKPGELVRLSDGAVVEPEEGVLRVTLQPYELAGFRASKKAQIVKVGERLPRREYEKVQTMIAAARAIQDEMPSEKLAAAVTLAEEALKAGHLWRARTVLEASDLIAVYRKAKRFPTGLYDFGSDVQ